MIGETPNPDIVDLERFEVVSAAAVNHREVIAFLKQHSSIEIAWDQSSRADWMLWIVQGALTAGLIPAT